MSRMSRPPLAVIDLGRRRYHEVLEFQRGLVQDRIAGELADDVLLLVEHEPVVTLGRGTRPESLPLPPGALHQRGLDVAEVERGGDVTWHGPGQLVGYPILDLQRLRPDLHWYLRTLELALIDALDRLGIAAGQEPGLTGVWTRGRKIASIGIHVKRWITLHGFALNVSADLAAFGLIVPCGIQGVVMTSVERELHEAGCPFDPAALWHRTRDEVVRALGHRLEREPRWVETGTLAAGDRI